MKTVFMGTPDFAKVILERLCDKIGLPELVVTQPDRPAGRGKKLTPPPVKAYAMEKGIPVLQPEHINEIADELKATAPDFIVVAAFGHILCRQTLDIPSRACVNVHASLLPEYRGAAPINAAIIDGRAVSGVTTMLMDEGLDSGDILLKTEVPIGPDDNAETLHDNLAEAGAVLCVKTILEFDAITPVKQIETEATYAPKMTKETGRVDWEKTAAIIRNLVRGCSPWPGTFTFLNGKMIKIWNSAVTDVPVPEDTKPGTILSVGDDGILTATGGGALLITELQAVGKKRLAAADFLRGFQVKEGDVFTRYE